MKGLLQFSVILFLLSFCYIVNTSSIDILLHCLTLQCIDTCIATYCIKWFLEMYIIHLRTITIFFSHSNIILEHYWIASLETWKFICIQTLRVFIDQFVCISAKCDDLVVNRWTELYFICWCMYWGCFFFHKCTSMLNIQRAMLWCGFCCDKIYHLQLFVRL